MIHLERYLRRLLPFLVAGACAAGEAPPRNLALEARATASETQDDLTPGKAVDGDPGTRWSGIPGHNQGVWFQLDFKEPSQVGEVVIRQYDRYVMELDVQIWDQGSKDWRTLRHLGRAGKRLPRIVLCRFQPEETSRLRIGNITNGPSFTEVEAYERPFSVPPSIAMASTLEGEFIGMVTDPWGAEPVEEAKIAMAGASRGGPWRAEGLSRKDGLFILPMPLGLEGKVRLEARLPGPGGPAPAIREFPAAGFFHGLTPLGGRQGIVSLNGRWRFLPDPPEGFWPSGFDDSSWRQIAVPSHWEMEGFRPREGIGGYRLRFDAPPGNGRLKLRFDGVYSGAEVWVNGSLVAIHEGGFTPFEVDITGEAREPSNILALRVRERTTTSVDLDRMSLYADFPLAGIIRSVSLFRVPEVHIGSLHVRTDFDADYRDAAIRGRLRVLNESGTDWKGSVRYRLADPRGDAVPLAGAPASLEVPRMAAADLEFDLPVKEPRKWDAEHPNLYILTVELHEGEKAVEGISERIGFRQTEVRGSELLVNGRPIKVRGTCHHDSHPLMGRAVTPELIRRDLALMKEANLNAVRTSHYPPLPDLPAIADELGLYVEDEAPFCWVGVSDDLNMAPRIIQLTMELIERDRNRPSVFQWSLCNESQFGRGFELSHERVREREPSRPTSAATSASLEIATLHNPLAISRIDETEKLSKPLIFDESLAPYQGIFNDVAEMWVDPGIRDYYAEPLPAIYDRFMRSRTTYGSMIWCWADDIFCVPNRGLEYGRGTTQCHFIEGQYRIEGRGLVGDAPWGLVDGWRRPKPEFWITKKLHSPVKVPEGPVPIPAGGAIRVPVENQFDFTDLSEIRIEWEIEGEKGTTRASVPPRSKGEIPVEPSRSPSPGDLLQLTFSSQKGSLIDAYLLPLGEEHPRKPSCARPEPSPLRIEEEDSLAGPATRIIGGDFELAFDRGGGWLRRCVGFGTPLLLELPAIHVLPTRSPQGPIPDRLSFRMKKLEVKKEGEGVRVELQGSYRDFEGGYELEVTPRGEITARASFRYRGEEMKAREIGMRISVPRDCDLLEWDRVAEWSVYPPDHIGRPRGEARAFADHPAELPPAWPWSLDGSPMGTNDFRSTKRRIRFAGLRHPGGSGILAEGGGLKHARAMVETDRISLHLSDWYGGTNVGWWEWTHNYGEGKVLKKDDLIESTVNLAIVR